MPKLNEDPKLLEHTRRVAAERKAKAIEREQQRKLRAITPGTATPLSVREAQLDSRYVLKSK